MDQIGEFNSLLLEGHVKKIASLNSCLLQFKNFYFQTL